MRSFGLLVGLIVVVAVPAAAQQHVLDGSLWTRFETRDIDTGPRTTFTWLQTRVELASTFGPNVRVFAQVQDTRRLGEETSTADASADRLDLHQGYLELGQKGDRSPWARLGRQEYEVAFGRLVGTPIWSAVSRSYDGVTLGTPVGESARVELFGFQIAEATGSPNPEDEYLAGGWGIVPVTDEQTLHLIVVHDRDDAPAETARTTLMTQLDGDHGTVSYRIEAASQTGTVSGLDITSGTLLAAFASAPWADGRGRFGLGIDRYGGDATPEPGETAGFSDLLGRNHRFLGFADLFNDPRANTGGRGLTDVNVRATWMVRPGLRFRADYHRFTLVDGSGFTGGKLADEIDLEIWGEVIDGLDVRAGGSWVGADGPAQTLGLSAGDQVFGYIQLSAGFWGGGPGRSNR